MRRTNGLALCILFFLTGCTGTIEVGQAELDVQEQRLVGFEGTYEYALDAPWRMEPYWHPKAGKYIHDPIPIQLSIFDEYQWNRDTCTWGPNCPFPVKRLGDVCHARVRRYSSSGSLMAGSDVTIPFDKFSEVEKTGLSPWGTGIPFWPFNASEGDIPWHGVCSPKSGEACGFYQTVQDTSEWHGLIHYKQVKSGRALLRVDLFVSREVGDCEDGSLIRFTNWVHVSLAEKPLPRFNDRWLYGDLHYHAQGTDNIAESAYNYRGVARALGALGLDFVFATEHNSNSRLIVDTDIDLFGGWEFSDVDRQGLRDMSQERFRFNLNELLHGSQGANPAMLKEWPDYRSRVPQVFLGGEADVIPEIPARPEHSHDEPPPDQTGFNNNDGGWPGETESEWFVEYGNGLQFDLISMCGGWHKILDGPGWSSCPGKITEPGDDLFPSNGEDGYFVKDVQGINDLHFGRQHVLVLPFGAWEEDGFVPSSTSFWGGATRRLLGAPGASDPGVAREIRPVGVGFLAHPLSASGGGEGPGSMPYSKYQLEKVLLEPGILGLQFWNENTRLKTHKEPKCSPPFVNGQFDFSDPDYLACVEDNDINDWDESGFSHISPPFNNGTGHTPGWRDGEFEFIPQYDLYTWTWQTVTDGVPHKLHHGSATWDRMLRWGLDIGRTQPIGWLPEGEPRKVFMAGGSDAHGDLNYRRQGYVVATEAITDTTLGKVRNLVQAGDPKNPCPPHSQCPEPALGERIPHSQDQVVAAIRHGVFSVTDGPAVRIVIDRNGNNKIDEQDIPMGGVVDLYNYEQLPLLVEWASTPEFGKVAVVDFYIGVDTSINPDCPPNDDVCAEYPAMDENRARTYAPLDHGTRRKTGDAPDPESGYCTTSSPCLMLDNYWYPGRWLAASNLLRIDLIEEHASEDQRYGDTRKINFDLRDYPLQSDWLGNRFYVRAFVRTDPVEPTCEHPDSPEYDLATRQGQCIERFGFTNPIWALVHPWEEGDDCPNNHRALDRDGDQIPDVCDAHPDDPNDGAWSRRFGGTSYDIAMATVYDSSGNLIAGGYFQNAATGITNATSQGSKDAWIAKLSPFGYLVWFQRLGGSGPSQVHDLALDPQTGDVIATGWFNGQLRLPDGTTFQASRDDVFLIRLSASGGDIQWAKTLQGPGRDVGNAVAVDNEGRITLVGYFQDSLSYLGIVTVHAQAGYDCFLTHWRSNGSLAYYRTIQGAGDCFANDLALTHDGDALVAGKFSGQVIFDPWIDGGERFNVDGFDAFLTKYHYSGAYAWNAYLGGINGTNQRGDAVATGVAVDDDDRIILAGHFQGWLQVDSGGQTYLRGITNGKRDIFIGMFDTEGGHYNSGQFQFGGSNHDYATSVSADDQGNYAVCGRFNSPYLNLGGQVMHRQASYDAFAASFSSNGQVEYADNFGVSGTNYAYALDLGPDGQLGLVGRFPGSIRLDDATTLHSLGSYDAYIARVR